MQSITYTFNLMDDTNFVADINAHELFGIFLRELIVHHSCTLEEAFQIVRHEIKVEYDRRVYERRAALKVISR